MGSNPTGETVVATASEGLKDRRRRERAHRHIERRAPAERERLEVVVTHRDELERRARDLKHL